MSRISWAVLVAALAGCHRPASQSPGMLPITSSPEALAGLRAAPAVEAHFGGVARNAYAERRMERVGRRLTRGAPAPCGGYQYRLLDSDRVNAVSLPAGRVYITRALYARLSNDDLLAAVLAHELAHLAAGDHFKPRPGDSRCALDRELSADAHGAKLLESGGYRRTAMIELVVLIADVQPAGWVDARRANLVNQPLDSHNPSVPATGK